MYGGVATPLALLHGEINGRTKQYNQMQNRSNSREDNYNGLRNPIRLPPLRETGQRERDHGNSVCENEPLLPTAPPLPKVCAKPKKLAHEESLPAPPLPPHKNNYQPIPRQQEMKYTPPWPRAPNPYSVITPRPPEIVKPYLKPLPKPPGKESPTRHVRKHQSPGPTPPPHQQPISPLPAHPQISPLPHQKTPERTTEFLRNKLQTRHNPLQNRHSPLHARRSPHHSNRHSPLQRHYSDESLGKLVIVLRFGIPGLELILL